LNKDLEGMVVKTTKMKIESKKRAESAKNKDAIKEIESFESKLDNFYKQSKTNLQSLKDGLCAPEESKADDKDPYSN
jgi:predicted hydrolase (HD superfamily)